MSAKPCTLAINNSGSWKTLGQLDAVDQSHAQHIMAVAEDLMKALNLGKPAKQCPTLRISADDALGAVLMYWNVERGWHQNPRGAP